MKNKTSQVDPEIINKWNSYEDADPKEDLLNCFKEIVNTIKTEELKNES